MTWGLAIMTMATAIMTATPIHLSIAIMPATAVMAFTISALAVDGTIAIGTPAMAITSLTIMGVGTPCTTAIGAIGVISGNAGTATMDAIMTVADVVTGVDVVMGGAMAMIIMAHPAALISR
jgi:hypothetical protein